MNKKGWIRIVEAFMAILLIVGVLFTIINIQNVDQGETSQKIYKSQIAILRNIENNDNLREEVLGVPKAELPVRWDQFDSRGLGNVSDRIIEKTPNYLECHAQVCNITSSCEYMNINPGGAPEDVNLYAQSVGITVTTASPSFDPRQLKIFCWLR